MQGLEKEFYIKSSATSSEEIGNDIHYGTRDKLIQKGISFTKRKADLTIGSIRALDIRVIFEDTEILYEGAVEDAPEEIKRLRYSKVENSDKMNCYVYNSN